MSTYLALTFGTLLSSQGTDTSFGPPSSGPSGRFVLSCLKLIRCFPLRFPEFHSSDSHSVAPLGATPELYGDRPATCKSSRPAVAGRDDPRSRHRQARPISSAMAAAKASMSASVVSYEHIQRTSPVCSFQK